ncbi:5-histidylcysteine sulfoxide synthase [Aromatoleum diolicum]|uniref:5-histidylcysteine sulfoxide synthase n=2 Tax=Aromatoleum diolicum TaxID=75796 RepID=A0ABX1QCJ1_9RHOO|nr:5-histidylcysteine sulfoxide synthase [Aromatoleum diolicum]
MTSDVMDEAWRQNLSGRLEEQLGPHRTADWWTGLPPPRCPGWTSAGSLTSLPLPNLAHCTRDQVRAYFDNGWTLTELLFSGLQGEEAFYRPPYHQLRHPMLFYYCHPPALYVNKLRVAGLIDAPLNAYFERIFETGVDEMRWDDMSKNAMRWPAFDEAYAYRKTVYALVSDVIANHPDLRDGHAPIDPSHPLWALFMGFEHERIHLETSSVLIRELPVRHVRRPEGWPRLHPDAHTPREANFPPRGGIDYPEMELLPVAAARLQLGKPSDWPSYGWDNEYGKRQIETQPFRAGRNLVSNGEFYQFVAAGGYRESRWWSPTGWAWRNFRNVKWPSFWVPDGPAGSHRYHLRTLFEVIDMRWDWPAEVNWHEARAYCNWLGERDGLPYRLPSEAEHNSLRDPVANVADDPVMCADGATLLRERGLNINLGCGSSGPVRAGRHTSKGFHDVFGNVWQWLEDHFNPLPGAQVHPYYDDFSSPCYDGQHQMMVGGSWISTGDEASVWSRFHFRPHFFQHAGFRVVQAAHDGGAIRLDNAGDAGQVYESAQVVDDYLLLHYGSAQEQMPHAAGPRDACEFPLRCARWLIDGAREFGASTGRAIDIGCAVGRASFELARQYQEVLGVDLSRAFIDTAESLRRDGVLKHFCRDEGELGHVVQACVDPAIARERVSFRQADAGSLPAELADFDAVLMANLLCRLPSPKSLLGRLGGPRGLVRTGGVVAIFSPYTWLEQFTPRGAWLGGYEGRDGPVHSAQTLRTVLTAEGFELRREAEFPLLIREHARKYQYIVTHAMLWQRVR